jgi:hypothetical protein
MTCYNKHKKEIENFLHVGKSNTRRFAVGRNSEPAIYIGSVRKDLSINMGAIVATIVPKH